MTRLVRFKDEFSFLLFRLVFHYFPFPLSLPFSKRYLSVGRSSLLSSKAHLAILVRQEFRARAPFP
jgi:hypothetical protein